MHTVKTYFSSSCRLGESPVWLKNRNSFVWLDILNKRLYERQYKTAGLDYQKQWKFEFTPTVIIPDNLSSKTVYLIADNGIYVLNLSDGSSHPLVDLNLPDTHRTNDGGVAPDGTIYFGTMQWQPDGKNGFLYSLSKNGILSKLSLNVAIPNTFVWIDSQHVAISDSFEQKTYLYRTKNCDLHQVDLLYDFSDYGGDPDGGTVDLNGMLWIALWDKGQVVCLDPKTKKITDHIDLPISRPSSCCFGGPDLNYLFITSAKSEKDNDQDGQCFIVKLDASGTNPHGFSLCK